MAKDRKDRRRWSRVPLNLLVQYRFGTFDDFIGQYAADISEGGMFIRCDDAREEGAMIYLQFALTDGTKLIEGLGRVVRVNPPSSPSPGMGIEFVSFDERSREMIDAIVREKRREIVTEDLNTTEIPIEDDTSSMKTDGQGSPAPEARRPVMSADGKGKGKGKSKANAKANPEVKERAADKADNESEDPGDGDDEEPTTN